MGAFFSLFWCYCVLKWSLSCCFLSWENKKPSSAKKTRTPSSNKTSKLSSSKVTPLSTQSNNIQTPKRKSHSFFLIFMLTDKIYKYLKDCYVCKFKLTPEDSSIECRSLNCNVYICAKCSVKPTEMVFRYSDGINEFYSKKHQINHN